MEYLEENLHFLSRQRKNPKGRLDEYTDYSFAFVIVQIEFWETYWIFLRFSNFMHFEWIGSTKKEDKLNSLFIHKPTFRGLIPYYFRVLKSQWRKSNATFPSVSSFCGSNNNISSFFGLSQQYLPNSLNSPSPKITSI